MINIEWLALPYTATALLPYPNYASVLRVMKG